MASATVIVPATGTLCFRKSRGLSGQQKLHSSQYSHEFQPWYVLWSESMSSAKRLGCVFRTKAAVQGDAMFASHDRNILGSLCVGF